MLAIHSSRAAQRETWQFHPGPPAPAQGRQYLSYTCTTTAGIRRLLGVSFKGTRRCQSLSKTPRHTIHSIQPEGQASRRRGGGWHRVEPEGPLQIKSQCKAVGPVAPQATRAVAPCAIRTHQERAGRTVLAWAIVPADQMQRRK